MKLLLRTMSIIGLLLYTTVVKAQCTGYSSATVNWDILNYFMAGGNITATMASSQNFALGKHKLTFAYNTGASVIGSNSAHTGETGSYGTGADIQFNGDATITLTFQPAVQSAKFSLYDIDYNQKIAVTASNSGTAVNVGLARVNSNVLGSPVNNNTTTPTITAGATSVADVTTADGTVNVDVSGPVTSITIVVSQTGSKTTGPAAGREPGDWWISDISACTNSFTAAYHSISQPYTGQPGYVLAARNNEVYMVNPATGKSILLFSDPSLSNINSMGYDPYNRILYFTNSLTGSGGTVNANDKTVKKYDFKTNTLSVLVSDVTAAPLNMILYASGVESGAASFYDGSLYLGIEGDAGGLSIVWRIDFDASLNPTSASQVWATATDTHDWGDFVIANGKLYDFDGKASDEDIFHLDLLTGTLTNTYHLPTFSARQVSVDWNEQIYNTGGAPSSTGEVAPYNNNGTINSAQQKTITVSGTSPSGSWGDAAEAFKPNSDFGDAPATYDPVAASPALHDIDVNLRLGATIDYEWGKTSSATAAADGGDEDGLPFVQVLTSGGNYYTDVSVFNNTGANATLCGWIDFNGDGVFQTSEGVSITVASSASTQVVQLFWPSVGTPLAANSYTFLRIRVTSAANSMTTGNSTGYFGNGEVEDYYLVVNASTLETKLTQFSATKLSEDKTNVKWQVQNEEKGTVYQLQRNSHAGAWQTIDEKTAVSNEQVATHTYNDESPVKPLSYYRLKYTTIDGKEHYSTVQKVEFNSVQALSIYPNPATPSTAIKIDAVAEESTQLQITDFAGRVVAQQLVQLKMGQNMIPLPVSSLHTGVYTVQLSTINKTFSQKLTIL